jgi:hypothetical protein
LFPEPGIFFAQNGKPRGVFLLLKAPLTSNLTTQTADDVVAAVEYIKK